MVLLLTSPPISDHKPLLTKGTPNYKASGPDGIPIEFFL